MWTLYTLCNMIHVAPVPGTTGLSQALLTGNTKTLNWNNLVVIFHYSSNTMDLSI